MISRRTNTYAPFDHTKISEPLRPTFAILWAHRGQRLARLRILVLTDQTDRALDNTLRRLSFEIPLAWSIETSHDPEGGNTYYTLITPGLIPDPIFTGKPVLPETEFMTSVISLEDMEEEL